MNRPNAFTLIELLVVITIIVVLLALLTPALDRAIYQAELATCAGSQKAVASGLSTYAFEQRRSYPYREAVRHPDTSVWPTWIAIPPAPSTVNKAGRGFDDRPMLRPYLSINAFNDPLAAQVDYDAALADQGASTGPVMWAGWVYKDPGTTASTGQGQTVGTGTGFRPRTKGMFRVGDRWTWVNPDAKIFRSSIIYGDYIEAGLFAGLYVFASHPESLGGLSEYVRDHYSQTGSGQADNLLEGMVHSSWRSPQAGIQASAVGMFDVNYAHADGSVRRFNDVPYDPNADREDRFHKVGIAQGANPGDSNLWFIALPGD